MWQPLALVVLIGCAWRHADALRGRPDSGARAVDHVDGNWYLTLADTRRVPVVLGGLPWLTPMAAVLPWRSRISGVALTQVVWPDTLDEPARRRLYRLLRGAPAISVKMH